MRPDVSLPIRAVDEVVNDRCLPTSNALRSESSREKQVKDERGRRDKREERTNRSPYLLLVHHLVPNGVADVRRAKRKPNKGEVLVRKREHASVNNQASGSLLQDALSQRHEQPFESPCPQP